MPGTNAALGDDYWDKLDTVLNQKVKIIEDKFDTAIAGLDCQVKTLQAKCLKYEEDIVMLKLIAAKQQQSLSRTDAGQRERSIKWT